MLTCVFDISDIVFHVRSPKVCSNAFGGKYTSLSDALDACMTKKYCRAVNFDGSRFQLTRSSRNSVSVGRMCWIRGGKFIEANGYMFDIRMNMRLTGYFNEVKVTMVTVCNIYILIFLRYLIIWTYIRCTIEINNEI